VDEDAKRDAIARAKTIDEEAHQRGNLASKGDHA
jgi:hypothetical protein